MDKLKMVRRHNELISAVINDSTGINISNTVKCSLIKKKDIFNSFIIKYNKNWGRIASQVVGAENH